VLLAQFYNVKTLDVADYLLECFIILHCDLDTSELAVSLYILCKTDEAELGRNTMVPAPDNNGILDVGDSNKA
jgi:hypothetical protein